MANPLPPLDSSAQHIHNVNGRPTKDFYNWIRSISDILRSPTTLSDFLDLAAVALSGDYADLTGTPTLGTAAALDVGTTANKVVQLDGSAKLPAVDGSQLTNLPSPGQPIPTTNAFAVGDVAMCLVTGGGAVNDGATTAGTNLASVIFDGSFTVAAGATLSGTWKNISGATLSSGIGNRAGYFVRTA